METYIGGTWQRLLPETVDDARQQSNHDGLAGSSAAFEGEMRLKCEVYDLQKHNMSLQKTVEDLQKQLNCKGAELAEAGDLRKLLNESTEREDKLMEDTQILRKELRNKDYKLQDAANVESNMKSEIADLQAKQITNQQTIQNLTYSITTLDDSQHFLLDERNKIIAILRDLAKSVNLKYDEDDTLNVVLFFGRVAEKVKTELGSAECKAAEWKQFLGKFGNLYSSACIAMDSKVTPNPTHYFEVDLTASVASPEPTCSRHLAGQQVRHHVSRSLQMQKPDINKSHRDVQTRQPEDYRLAVVKRAKNVVRSSRNKLPLRYATGYIVSRYATEEDASDDAAMPISRPFPCHYCRKRFEKLPLLKRHLTKSHGKIDPLKGTHGCGMCGRLFLGQRAHLEHRRLEHSKQTRNCIMGPDVEVVTSETLPEESEREMPDLTVANGDQFDAEDYDDGETDCELLNPPVLIVKSEPLDIN